MYCSVWQSVLFWCFLSFLATFAAVELKQRNIINLSLSNYGHKLGGLLLSFLLTLRISIGIARFNEQVDLLIMIFSCGKELMINTVTFTRNCNTAQNREWRLEVSGVFFFMLFHFFVHQIKIVFN